MGTHVDVLIAGAGISGIAAAYHLQRRCPGKSFTILEGRDRLGGTWDIFRFPGIRSDSDMHTLGFSFRPWPEKDWIGEGADILRYLEETAAEIGIEGRIEFGKHIERASFSTRDSRWTVQVRDTATGERHEYTCSFFWSCMGYYRYDRGYTPEFAGMDVFAGQILHPQFWDEHLDYEGKRVLIIGSGATAMTMLPVMATKAAKVTMLQRSPTYVIAWARHSRWRALLNFLLGPELAHRFIRWRNVKLMAFMYWSMRRFPNFTSRLLIRQATKALGKDYDVETHFTPHYKPWDQRVCLVPDGDIFEPIADGRAEVVTDRIDTFTERGVRLMSGTELEADIIVTATGFDLQWMGGVDIDIDGKAFDVPKSMIYKGCMLSDLPNAAFVFGYINSSWTLRAELVCDYVCRLLQLMDDRGYTQCCPVRDPSVDERPAIELTAGYVKRSEAITPAQGDRAPWRFNQSYALDKALLLDDPIDDGTLKLTSVSPARTREDLLLHDAVSGA